MGISQWLTQRLYLVHCGKDTPGKRRFDGKGNNVWRGRGGESRVSKEWNFIRAVHSPFLCFCLCVLFRAPAAFPSWFHSKALEVSQTGQLYDCVSICPCMRPSDGKCGSYTHTQAIPLPKVLVLSPPLLLWLSPRTSPPLPPPHSLHCKRRMDVRQHWNWVSHWTRQELKEDTTNN